MFGRRNGGAEGAEITQKLAALEVRLASLAQEVHDATRKVEVWGAREIVRQEAIEAAVEQLGKRSERLRKYAEAARRDGRADADDRADPDGDAFYEVYKSRGGLAAP